MKVLFICKGNWFRSQMAMELYNKLTNSKDAISAGTYTGASDEPENSVLSEVIHKPFFFETMEKRGMNVRLNRSTKLTPALLQESDIVVSMAEDPYSPQYLKNDRRVIWWDVENPTYLTEEICENTFNKISYLVQELIEKIK